MMPGSMVQNRVGTGLIVTFCAAILFAFGLSSLLAMRCKGWREVALLVQIQILTYLTTGLILTGAILLGEVLTTLWTAVLICFGLGSAWIMIYLKKREEVRRLRINIKEF